MAIFGILSSLITFALFGAVIYGVVRLVGGSKQRTHGAEPSVTLRSALVYGALYVAVVVAAIGATTVLTEVFGGERFGDTASSLARGLSFLIVAVPASYLLLRYVRGRLDSGRAERHSAGWSIYINLTLATSLVVTMVSAALVVASALDDWAGGPLASLVVWGAIWTYHWFGLLARYGAPGSLHLAFGSTAGLVTLAGGLGTALVLPLNDAYDSLTADRIAGGSLGDEVAVAVTVALVGAAAWWWHWLARYRVAPRDGLWHSYVMVPGVLAGTLAAIGSLVWTLAASAVWVLGDPSPNDAGRFFDFLPAALVVLAIATLAWWYHRGVLRSEGVPERTEPLRVYDYVMAAVGLVAAAAGSTAVIVALLDAITSTSVSAGSDSATNTLIVAVTLLVTGAPLWWGFWRRIETIAATDPTERVSETRRVFLFGLFGAGGVTAFISLIVLIYGLLDPLLSGDFGTAAVRDVRVALALVLTVGAVAWFHFAVWRADRALVGESAGPEVRSIDVVLVTSDDALGEALRRRLGGTVEVWHRVHDGGGPVDPDELAAMVLATQEPHVLVVTGEAEPLVVPFEG